MNESEEELLDLLTEGWLEFGLGMDCPGYDLPLRPGLSQAVLALEPIFVLLPSSRTVVSALTGSGGRRTVWP